MGDDRVVRAGRLLVLGGTSEIAGAIVDELPVLPGRSIVLGGRDRPGFVRTRMTESLAASPLATTPERVARAALRGIQGGADTVWAPAVPRRVVLLLRATPGSVFARIPA